MILLEPGDELPSNLREAYQGEDASSIHFNTGAQVIESFGGGHHVYPIQSIESVEDFLTVPETHTTDPTACFSTGVRWYTQPREEL